MRPSVARLRAAAALLALLAPAAAAALPPPPDWRPTTYAGPGLLCGDGYDFRMEAGETATRGFPSEGYVPLVVRSHGGAFAITAYDFSLPQVDKRLLSRSGAGTIYLVTRVRMDVASGVPKLSMYWFQPASGGAPFSVAFFAAVPNSWAAFPPDDYLSVVRRVSFAGDRRSEPCLTAEP